MVFGNLGGASYSSDRCNTELVEAVAACAGIDLDPNKARWETRFALLTLLTFIVSLWSCCVCGLVGTVFGWVVRGRYGGSTTHDSSHPPTTAQITYTTSEDNNRDSVTRPASGSSSQYGGWQDDLRSVRGLRPLALKVHIGKGGILGNHD